MAERGDGDTGVNFRSPVQNYGGINPNIPATSLQLPDGFGSGTRQPMSRPQQPALPPRPPGLTSNPNTYNRYPPYNTVGGNYNTMGNFGALGGNFGYGSPAFGNNGYPFSPYGATYGSYGGYSPYGSAAAPQTGSDPLVQMAQENYRNAFSSIETVVHALSSVGMMLESTVAAVHTSFQAVLHVAEHIGELNTHFSQVLSTLSLLRSLRWLFRKALYLIGARLVDPSSEAIWNSVAAESSNLTEADIKKSHSSWQSLAFCVMVFGGPYLLWRLLRRLSTSVKEKQTNRWARGEGEHFTAVAEHEFQSTTPKELPFQAGQNLRLAPHNLQPSQSGWILASNGRHIGYIPSNYIRIISKVNGPVVQKSNNRMIINNNSACPPQGNTENNKPASIYMEKQPPNQREADGDVLTQKDQIDDGTSSEDHFEDVSIHGSQASVDKEVDNQTDKENE